MKSFTPPVFANTEADTLEYSVQDSGGVQSFSTPRALKKLCRKGIPGLLLLSIADEASQILAEQAAEYIRLGLSNLDVRIVVIVGHAEEAEMPDWGERLAVSAILRNTAEDTLLNKQTIKRELDNYNRLNSVRSEHNLEVQLLMAVTRFSESGMAFSSILDHFYTCLGEVCASSLSIQIAVKEHSGTLEKYDHEHQVSEADLNGAFRFSELSECLKKAITEKKPQVSISSDEFDVSVIQKKLDKQISGFLVFPILAYDRVVKILFYLISQEDMEKITVNRIDLITKAFDLSLIHI